MQMNAKDALALKVIKPLLTWLARRSPDWRAVIRDSLYVAEAQNADHVTPQLRAQYDRPDADYSQSYNADDIPTSALAQVAEAALDDASKQPIVEIGASSGALSAYLARRGRKVIGIDFNLDNALAKYGNTMGLSLRTGYPLDVIRDIEGPFTLIATSTLVCMPRRELDSYLDEIAARASRIVVREPIFAGRGFAPVPPDMPVTESRHTKGLCWHHPLAPLLVARGYRIKRFETHGEHLFIDAAK